MDLMFFWKGKFNCRHYGRRENVLRSLTTGQHSIITVGGGHLCHVLCMLKYALPRDMFAFCRLTSYVLLNVCVLNAYKCYLYHTNAFEGRYSTCALRETNGRVPITDSPLLQRLQCVIKKIIIRIRIFVRSVCTSFNNRSMHATWLSRTTDWNCRSLLLL
jgi:hypothetical protein